MLLLRFYEKTDISFVETRISSSLDNRDSRAGEYIGKLILHMRHATKIYKHIND